MARGAGDTRTPAAARTRTGTLAGLTAYGLWGVFPLVFHQLEAVSPFEILYHRIVWSLAVVLGLLVAQGRRAELWAVMRDRRRLRLLAVAAACISVNWLTYIWAVNNGHVLDAALGYYVNPLVTVGIGVVVLGERLRRTQMVALGFGTAAVVVLTVANGAVPWIALVLAISFATYGYLKKLVDVAALPTLAIETAVLAPIAVVGLAILTARGTLAFGPNDPAQMALLASLGVVTAVPLLLFATAATRIPLSLLGLLQYVTPTMQLIVGITVLHEDLPPERLAGFALVWIALSVLASDAIGNERRLRRGALVASDLSLE